MMHISNVIKGYALPTSYGAIAKLHRNRNMKTTLPYQKYEIVYRDKAIENESSVALVRAQMQGIFKEATNEEFNQIAPFWNQIR